MSIAHLVAERANCIRKKVGCLIVKNNRVLSTGYNGTPSKLENCFLGGCERCNTIHIQGENLDKDLCLHAEESAVRFYLKRLLNLVKKNVKMRHFIQHYIRVFYARN